MTDEILKILEYFPVGRCRVLRGGGGTASPKYIIRAGNARYLLRKRRAEFSGEKTVRFDQSVIMRLAEEGFPVAVPEETIRGKRAVYSGKEVWELFRYIEGLEDFRQGNKLQIISAGKTLGGMHRALSQFEPEGEKPWTREFHPAKIERELADAAAELKGALNKDIAGRIFGELRNLSENYARRDLTRSVIHGDYTSANVKFRGGAAGGIFDFDWTMREAVLYDIARGIAYFTAAREKPVDDSDIFSLVQPCRIIPERAELFMEAYSEEFELSRNDVLNLPCALKEFFIGSRVRAMRKAPEGRKPELLDERLLRMLDEAENDWTCR